MPLTPCVPVHAQTFWCEMHQGAQSTLTAGLTHSTLKTPAALYAHGACSVDCAWRDALGRCAEDTAKLSESLSQLTKEALVARVIEVRAPARPAWPA